MELCQHQSGARARRRQRWSRLQRTAPQWPLEARKGNQTALRWPLIARKNWKCELVSFYDICGLVFLHWTLVSFVHFSFLYWNMSTMSISPVYYPHYVLWCKYIIVMLITVWSSNYKQGDANFFIEKYVILIFVILMQASSSKVLPFILVMCYDENTILFS